MTYTALDSTKPTTAQTRQAAVDSMRTNAQALRDRLMAALMMGAAYSVTTGPNDQPTEILLALGAERWKGGFQWGTTGGGSGNVVKEAWWYSSNTGTTYDNMLFEGGTNYVMSYSYDTAGNLSSTTAGATWP